MKMATTGRLVTYLLPVMLIYNRRKISQKTQAWLMQLLRRNRCASSPETPQLYQGHVQRD